MSGVSPSFHGIVLNSRDALLLFTDAIHGRIPMISRRPHDKERTSSITSGNIFIYCEHSSSIKRWTDGVTWSPSRIMGNFLIYRELIKGFPPGEKKRAAKKKQHPEDGSESPTLEQAEDDMLPPLNITKDDERMLIGSLIDSYDFKREGLVKKTISVKFQDQVYHLVSYYTLRHALASLLNKQPSKMSQFATTQLIEELVTGQNFRVAVDVNGTDVASTSNTPPPSTGSPGPSHRYPDDDPYSQGHHPTYMPSPGHSGYNSPALMGRYDVQRESALSYETSTTPTRTYSGYPPNGGGDVSLYSPSIPRSQMQYPIPSEYPGYPQDSNTRSYSISPGMLGGSHAMEGNPHAGMQQGRSQSYSAGGQYSGMTEPSSYVNGAPSNISLLSPSRSSLSNHHPLAAGPLFPEKNNGSIGGYLPATRQQPSSQGHPDDAQRPGLGYQIGEDPVTFNQPNWS